LNANLIFRAGTKALQKIKDNGLQADDVKVMAGAAGGSKWLILGHLDRYLFGSFFQSRQEPLYLIGSSSGAWRFAAASHTDPLAAIQRFEDAYINQSYEDNPTPKEVSDEAGRILKHLLGDQGAKEILSHPFMRLNFMTVRGRGWTGSDLRPKLFAGLSMAVLGNFISRRLLGWFFERGLFHDPRDVPPFAGMQDLPINKIQLTPENMENVLLVAPSPSFIAALPDGKIPDRNDFYIYKGRDKERIANWNKAVHLSRQLADELIEAVESSRIRKEVQLLT